MERWWMAIITSNGVSSEGRDKSQNINKNSPLKRTFSLVLMSDQYRYTTDNRNRHQNWTGWCGATQQRPVHRCLHITSETFYNNKCDNPRFKCALTKLEIRLLDFSRAFSFIWRKRTFVQSSQRQFCLSLQNLISTARWNTWLYFLGHTDSFNISVLMWKISCR